MNYPIKRNLDGVFYHVKRDGKWSEVCYSDLTQQERNQCTEKYTLEEMKQPDDRMADALRNMGDVLNVIASFEERDE